MSKLKPEKSPQQVVEEIPDSEKPDTVEHEVPEFILPLEPDVQEEIEEVKDDVQIRIAVFYKNWIESTLLAPGMPNCYLRSWKILQIVSEKDDIERLISLNAPIKVYVEDGSYRCTER